MEEFKSFDKKSMLFSVGNALRTDIDKGLVEANPASLVRFLLLTFADLKKHTYIYWFAFPALLQRGLTIRTLKASPQNVTVRYASYDLAALSSRMEEAARFTCQPFFVCRFVEETCHVLELTQWAQLSKVGHVWSAKSRLMNYGIGRERPV